MSPEVELVPDPANPRIQPGASDVKTSWSFSLGRDVVASAVFISHGPIRSWHARAMLKACQLMVESLEREEGKGGQSNGGQ